MHFYKPTGLLGREETRGGRNARSRGHRKTWYGSGRDSGHVHASIGSYMSPVVLVCACAEERSAWPDAETVRTRILLLMCAARARRAMQDQPAHRGTFQTLDHELLSLCARAVSVTLTFSPWRHIAPVRDLPIENRAGLLQQYITRRRFQRALDALESYIACGGDWNDKLALLWPELFRRRPALPHVAFINELGRAHRGETEVLPASAIPARPDESAHHVRRLDCCLDGLPSDTSAAVLKRMVAFKGPEGIEGRDGQTKRELHQHATSLLRDEWIRRGKPADEPTYHEFIRLATDAFLEVSDVWGVLDAPTPAQVGESVLAKWVVLEELLRTDWDALSGHPTGATLRALFDSSIDTARIREGLVSGGDIASAMGVPPLQWDATVGAPEPIQALAAASRSLGIEPSHCRILLCVDGR